MMTYEQIQNIRRAFDCLIEGAVPDDITPETLGDWWHVYEELHTMLRQDGLLAVRKAIFNNKAVRTLLCANIHPEPTIQPGDIVDLARCHPLPARVQQLEDARHGACVWMDRYIAFSQKWSPRSYKGFHIHCGLWVLSSISARRVVCHLMKPRYTSLLLAIVARTSVWAKSSAANIATDTIRAAGLLYLLAPDESTPEAYLKRISTTSSNVDGWGRLSSQNQELLKAQLAFSAQRGWFYDEFGQKIQAMMKPNGTMAAFRSMFKRFDDCKEEYTNDTITRGLEPIKKPFLALLASMTPADLASYAGKGSLLWNDGFFARFAFSTPHPDEKPEKQRSPRGKQVIPSELISPLVAWHKRLGIPGVEVARCSEQNGKPTEEYTLTIEDLPEHECFLSETVEDAYYTYMDALIDIIQEQNFMDLDGNYARFPEKALRAAMLVASLENNNRIELRHWAFGQHWAEQCRRDLHHLVAQLNTTTTPTTERVLEDEVLRLLERKNEAMTATEMGRYMHFGREEVEQCLNGLLNLGLVQSEPSPKSTRYRLTGTQEKDASIEP